MIKRHEAAIYVITIALSLLAHTGTIMGLSAAAQREVHARRAPIEMSVFSPPPPPEPEPEIKPEPKPKKELPPPPPPPKMQDVVKAKLPPPDLPPPPNTDAGKEAVADAKPIFGVTMTSVVGPGSGSGFSVRVGNTLMKKQEEEFTKPEEVKAYKPVPLHQLTTLPKRQGECAAETSPEALQLGIEGKVRLKIEILIDGSVGKVEVISGLGHGLDEAAIEAIKKCKFRAAMRGDDFVPTQIVYTFTFFIDD